MMSETNPDKTSNEDSVSLSDSDSGGGTSNNRNLFFLALALIVLVICGAFAVFLALRGRETEAVPTVAPTAEGLLPTTTPGGADLVWAKIQESGVIVVGTSADYPPFEYYSEDFVLDGFDIALFKELGRLMGLDVAVHDMAFDGLFDALRVSQIDAAIAAITVTDDREKVVDFSNVYFVSDDAALIAAGSAVSLIKAEDLANYRIGVQAGTIYQNFVESSLVETGLMAGRNLNIYPLVDQALADLSSGRIDVVLLDKAPAEVAVGQGGLAIAATSLNRQLLAISIPQDAFTLQAELNRALAQLQAEGRVAELVETYFGSDPGTLPPVPTPAPPQATATPEPPAGCINAMAWVSDLSYDDQNFTNISDLAAGSAFQKGWRLRNSGTCTWDNSYSLLPVDGNDPAARMGGLPTPVVGTVVPGQTYDFYVNLTAPIKPGTYVEYWTMRSPQGTLFGDRVWVAINVPAPATPTPPPTETPSASISFSANPQTILEGQCSTLSWSTQNVRAVYVYPQGEPWQNYGVPGSGSQAVCPAETTTFEMRVVNLNGSVETRTTTVFVTPNPQAPEITRFTVEPPYSITAGECVLISWSVTGKVNTVNIFRNEVAIWQNAPVSGQVQDCPPGAGQYTYRLDASGSGGSSAASQTIQVVAPATPTPTATTPPLQPTNTPLPTATSTTLPPTATPIPDPVIYSFAATPEQLETGQCTTVSWSVGGNTSQVQLLKDGNVVYDNAPLRGSERDCNLNQAGAVTYGIQATNDAGGSASQQATIQVVDSAPDNPLAMTNWVLVSYLANGQATAVIPGPPVSASFAASEVSGSAGCNTFSADYTVTGSNITFEPAIVTQLVCGDPPGIMEQESLYLSLLPMAATYQITNNQLTISDALGQIILSYTALVATPF